MWQFVWVKSKYQKLPKQINGAMASSTDPSTWASYDDCADALMGGGFDGIGFVLGDGIVGVDLDDHYDPLSGEPDDLANEVLANIQGYAEVSPSGCGIKILCRADSILDSATHKASGIEFYPDGRYFTITGQALNGRSRWINDPQDAGLQWLIDKVNDLKGVSRQLRSTSSGEYDPDSIEFDNSSEPVSGWDAERIKAEILPHVTGNEYDEWLEVGACLHHQFQGDTEGLDLWDEWSAQFDGYDDGACEAKWRSFSESRGAKRVKTLRTLLLLTREKRAPKTFEQAAAARESESKAVLLDKDQRIERIAKLKVLIDQAPDIYVLEHEIASRVAACKDFSAGERETIAVYIQRRTCSIDGVGARGLPIKLVREWVQLSVTSGGPAFTDVTPEGKPICNIPNLKTLMNSLGWSIRYNVISKDVEVVGAGLSFSEDNYANAVLAEVASQCATAGMNNNFGVLKAYLTAIADRNQYNPALTWIESNAWDGRDRFKDLAETLVLQPGFDPAMRDMVLRKWLIQAVAAVASPDPIQLRGVLVLQGDQYIGKSRWLLSLVPGWPTLALTGRTLDPHSKDSLKIAITHWLVELGELDSTFRKSDIAALKAFIAQDRDVLRLPYAPSESKFQRRTVFFGSVNDPTFLHDETGNTRFWVVPVQRTIHDHSIDMQQVWAQALQLWRQGEVQYLSQEDMARVESSNENFTIQNPIYELVTAKFAWKAPKEDNTTWVWMTSAEVLQHCGITKPSRSDSTSAGLIMKKLFPQQPTKRSTGGVRFYAVPTFNGLGNNFDEFFAAHPEVVESISAKV